MKRALGLMVLGGLAIGVALAGCSKKESPTAPQPLQQTGPTPNSTTNALDAAAWGMNHLQWKPVAELLSDDFQFVFAASDSVGNAFTGHALDRDEALLSLQHLLETGTDTQPPASSVNLVLDRTFVAFPDSRPGKLYPWHQEIRSTLTLSIDAGDQAYRILGHLRFFVTRGDSAAIPPDLVAKGFRPDPNRWWIERIEDETVGGAGGLDVAASPPVPTKSFTLGTLLAIYL